MSKKPPMADALKGTLAMEANSLEERFRRAEIGTALMGAKSAAAEPLAHSAVLPAAEPPKDSNNDVAATKPAAEAPKKAKAEPAAKLTYSFTEADYDLMTELKRRCNFEGFEAARSELLRAGLQCLAKLSGPELHDTINSLERLKPGRRRKSH